jgi:hypothetical protein
VNEQDVWAILIAAKVVSKDCKTPEDHATVVRYLTKRQLQRIAYGTPPRTKNGRGEYVAQYRISAENELVDRSLGQQRKNVNEHRKKPSIRL